MQKLIIGFILFDDITAKYLEQFLDSLQKQSWQDFTILAIDHSQKKDNKNRNIFNKLYPQASIEWPGKNLGFAAGYNRLIERASKFGAEYFLALNVDTIHDSNMLQNLVSAMDKAYDLGSVSPKIKRWDFAGKKKTADIDSCGIVLRPGLKFVDLGTGQIDKGQFDEAEILGPSGAAAFYRMSALESVKEKTGYFDERMFMYKEDCDLDYRLHLAGFKSQCIGSAVIYHDRTVTTSGESVVAASKARGTKSKQVKIWSFRNQLLIYKKHWHSQNIKNKIIIIFRLIAQSFYIIIKERYLFKEIFNIHNS